MRPGPTLTAIGEMGVNRGQRSSGRIFVSSIMGGALLSFGGAMCVSSIMGGALLSGGGAMGGAEPCSPLVVQCAGRQDSPRATRAICAVGRGRMFVPSHNRMPGDQCRILLMTSVVTVVGTNYPSTALVLP